MDTDDYYFKESSISEKMLPDFFYKNATLHETIQNDAITINQAYFEDSDFDLNAAF